MPLHKTLQAGDCVAVSGACVITATKGCGFQIAADDSVTIGSLTWELGTESGLLQATGSSGQAYIIYDGGASLYEYVDCKLTEHPIYKGSKAKHFCEVHNQQRGKE
jgi:hypothetical protein